MKTTIKLGAISFNAFVAEKEIVTHSVTTQQGELAGKPQVLATEHTPAKKFEFHMHESEITFEYEVGEIAGIYKEFMPAVKDIMDAFVEVKKAGFVSRETIERMRSVSGDKSKA